MNAASSIASSYRAPAFIDFQPGWSGKGATEARLEALREHSVVIIEDFVDSEWIPILREAGRRATEVVYGASAANGAVLYDPIELHFSTGRRPEASSL